MGFEQSINPLSHLLGSSATASKVPVRPKHWAEPSRRAASRPRTVFDYPLFAVTHWQGNLTNNFNEHYTRSAALRIDAITRPKLKNCSPDYCQNLYIQTAGFPIDASIYIVRASPREAALVQTATSAPRPSAYLAGASTRFWRGNP
jgi:hypothetical protein